MTRIGLIAILFLAGCTPGGSVSSQMRDHDEYMKTNAEVTEALNQPNGPDYAAAVRVIEKSSRVPLQKDYNIGNLILKACHEGRSYCAAPNDGLAGAARLARVARTPGEDRDIAAGDLAFYLRSGAGPTLPPSPILASCWDKVSGGTADAASCSLPAPSR